MGVCYFVDYFVLEKVGLILTNSLIFHWIKEKLWCKNGSTTDFLLLLDWHLCLSNSCVYTSSLLRYFSFLIARYLISILKSDYICIYFEKSCIENKMLSNKYNFIFRIRIKDEKVIIALTQLAFINFCLLSLNMTHIFLQGFVVFFTFFLILYFSQNLNMARHMVFARLFFVFSSIFKI